MQKKKGVFSNPYINNKHSHILSNSRNYNSRESINKIKFRQTSPITYASNSSNRPTSLMKQNKQNTMSLANKPNQIQSKGPRKSKQVFRNKQYKLQNHLIMHQEWIDGKKQEIQNLKQSKNGQNFQLFRSLVQLQEGNKTICDDKFSVFTKNKQEYVKQQASNRIRCRQRTSNEFEQSFNNTFNDSFLSRIQILEPQGNNTNCKTHKRFQSSKQQNSQCKKMIVVVTPNKKLNTKKASQKEQTNNKETSIYKHRRSVSYKSPYSQKSNDKQKMKEKLLQVKSKTMTQQQHPRVAQQLYNQNNFIEMEYEDKLIEKLQQSNKRLVERNKTLEQSQKQYQQRILQYQQYVRQISQQLNNSRKYQQGIKHTVMWMLQLYCFYGQTYNNSQFIQVKQQKFDFKQYFMKVFKTYNQYLDQLKIQNRLQQINCLEKQRNKQSLSIFPYAAADQIIKKDSLDNSFEDTFNFAFRKAYKIKPIENQQKSYAQKSTKNNKLKQADISHISKKLFGNSTQKARVYQCEIDNLRSSRNENAESKCETSNVKSEYVSQLQYSITEEQNFERQEKQVKFSQLESKVTIISNLQDYQIQNVNNLKGSEEQTFEFSTTNNQQIRDKIEALVVQQYEQQEQNYITPLRKGQIITLVRQIDDELWIGQTLEKIGYVKNSILKFI